MNPPVMSLQSPFLEMATNEEFPCALRTLLMANCDPNAFGNPEKSPLAEGTLRNDINAVEVLLEFKANRNLPSSPRG